MNIHSLAWFRHASSGYESERAGDGRGVFFLGFMKALVRAHHAVWDGWQLRIHHDDRVREFPYFKALVRMEEAGLLRLVPTGPSKTLCGSMLLRLLPIFEEGVEWVVCRDIDSLPMPRDRKMVEQAMEAGASIHGILDSESHSGPLMGGMIAFHAPIFRREGSGIKSVDEFVERASTIHGIDMNQHGADQRALNTMIWPLYRKETFIHQSKNYIVHPDAMKSEKVLPKTCEQDNLFSHIGGCGDAQKAQDFYDANVEKWPIIKRIQECERE